MLGCQSVAAVYPRTSEQSAVNQSMRELGRALLAALSYLMVKISSKQFTN